MKKSIIILRDIKIYVKHMKHNQKHRMICPPLCGAIAKSLLINNYRETSNKSRTLV